MEKIYLIGQISNPKKTYEETYEKFATWEFKLKELGYEVLNPMKSISEHMLESVAKKVRATGLVECDSIILLEDWKDSPWAQKEFQIAVWLDYKIYTQNDYEHLLNLAQTLKAATPESSQ